MSTAFEDRLRTLLADEAGRAPLAQQEWPGVPAAAPAHRRPGPLLAAAAAVALLVAGGLALRARSDGPATGDGTPTFLRGEEYRLVAVDSPTLRTRTLVRAESVHAVLLPDLGVTVAAYEDAFTDGGLLRRHCFEVSNVGTGCTPLDGPNVGISWGPEPDGKGVATWTTLPPGTDVVQLVQTDGVVRWQRPVGGIAAFPVTGDDQPTLEAYDAEGNLLERVPPDVDPPAGDPSGPPAWLPDGDEAAVQIGRAAAEACLAETPDAWDACVEEGRRAAVSAVAQA